MKKSYREIIRSHIFTFFNLLNLIYFVMIMSVGSFKNGLFMIVIVANALIGIFQEIRTKKTLDDLSLITKTRFPVQRGTESLSLFAEEMQEGDMISLQAGDQIPADGILKEGLLEVDESLLSGESEVLDKQPGSNLLSGSVVISGTCVMQAVTVGNETYASSLTEKAKDYNAKKSELQRDMNTILHTVAWMIIPLSILLFAKLYFVNELPIKNTVEQVVASGVGMIPEGLVLLTSVSLAVGAFNLAMKKVLVQQLYSIESLARVDVICLDKTGTLTTGKVMVDDIFPEESREDFLRDLHLFASAFKVGNDTLNGIQNYLITVEGENEQEPRGLKASYVVPFSSQRKYSGAAYPGFGTIYMGASEMLFPKDPEITEHARALSGGTGRVLVLAGSEEEETDRVLPEKLELLGYIRMKDELRYSVGETLAFFKSQDVGLKLISGDDPYNVSRIAGELGMADAGSFLDLSTLETEEEVKAAALEYTIFGRVRPEQKRLLVEALQEDGHTVAMVGDGVNDVLALKIADCSIAMGNGADAARRTADVILTESDFAAMPRVLNEGRRVINNIGRSASMYLVKTFFSVVLTLLTLLFGYHYPFISIQLSLISSCAVGLPTLLFQLEPSYEPVKKGFIGNVVKFALPPALVISAIGILLVLLSEPLGLGDESAARSLVVFSTAYIYFLTLIRLYPPKNLYRILVLAGCIALFIVLVALFGSTLFELHVPNSHGFIALGVIAIVSPALILVMEKGIAFINGIAKRYGRA